MLQNPSKETQAMEVNTIRRSDRISLELVLQLSGTDSMGGGYIEEGHTLLLSRHGAKIVLNRKLMPNQELTLRCLATGLSADARVVGQIGRGPHGYFYGIEFLNDNANPWKIEFPPPAEAREAVARTLLECASCNTRAVIYLSDIEAEIFASNRCLSRVCRNCAKMGLWIEPNIAAPDQPAPEQIASGPEPETPLAKALRTQNERKETRSHLRLTASIRSPEFGEEIVITEDVSPGGFRFKSPRRYSKGSIIEIAVPYSRKAGNIFVLAQLEWEFPLPNEGVLLYGAWYVQMQGSKIQRIEEKP